MAAALASPAPASPPPRRRPEASTRPEETHDILDLRHDRLGDDPGAPRTVGQNPVDLRRFRQQPLHLAADLAQGRDGEVRQHVLEMRELAAGELGQDLAYRPVAEGGI